MLHGEATALTEHITGQMNAAAAALDFETAAMLRDRLRMLATVREKQFVDTTGSEADADVVAVAEAGGRDRGQPDHDPRRPPSGRPQLLPATRRRSDAGRSAGSLYCPALPRTPDSGAHPGQRSDRDRRAGSAAIRTGRQKSQPAASRHRRTQGLDRHGTGQRPAIGRAAQRRPRQPVAAAGRAARHARPAGSSTASNASTSRTPWAKRPWPRAWCTKATT